jgi:predicted O-methyltransferase YrrM
MTPEKWNEVDDYITDRLVKPDAVLKAALESSTAAGMPPIAVSPAQGKLLHLLALISRAKNILEIGTLGGYSAIWMARALPPGGKLITLESDAKHAAVAKANIERAGLTSMVEIRLGKALQTLPLLAAEKRGPFDLTFIDADKQSIPEYFSWALEHSHPGSLIIVDNVVRGGAVVEAASTDGAVQGVRRLNEMLFAENRVTATAIQTVGIKGYDGFAIARVNE